LLVQQVNHCAAGFLAQIVLGFVQCRFHKFKGSFAIVSVR
jgi:hypothetical protein